MSFVRSRLLTPQRLLCHCGQDALHLLQRAPTASGERHQARPCISGIGGGEPGSDRAHAGQQRGQGRLFDDHMLQKRRLLKRPSSPAPSPLQVGHAELQGPQPFIEATQQQPRGVVDPKVGVAAGSQVVFDQFSSHAI